jgi:hypothetical protein
MHTDCVFIRRLPRDLKAHFKSACTLMGESMTRVFIRMMRQYVKEVQDGPPTKRKRKYHRRRKRVE